jgi:isoquinoline 1-oxidoreductase subunit beta
VAKGNKISRRNFILSAAAACGGLAIGLRISRFAPSLAIEPGVEIHNWIVVAPDNTVTIRIAQMEMGQGAMTSMAQLMAEELEVDWSKIRTEFISIARHLARDRVYGRTNVVGSGGVTLSQGLLRTAGAQIRTMLVKAAAKRFEVPEAELVAENSIITHRLTGRTLTYGEVANDAAKVAVPDPDAVKLKDPKNWRYIGKSVKRVDIPMKTDGTAIFGTDVKLPGLKHAAIAMSPVFGGKLASYDASAALSQPGVCKVVEIKGGVAGDAIAIVAEDWWQAKTALDSISVDWDGDGRAMTDSASILANLRAGLRGPPDRIFRRDGNAEVAMTSAAQTLEADYFVPYLEHATMEPMNCTALITDDGFEVWAGTQLPEGAINLAASVAGMPVSTGNLHVPQIGGGFGRRQESDFVAQAVEIAKALKGVPVKLLWSREDTTQHGFYRPANLSRVQGALDAEGNLVSWRHRIVAPSDNEVLGRFGADSLLYVIPNITVDFVVKRSHVPEGQMRGVGFATHGFVTQSFMDELARAAGKDSYAFQFALLDPDRTPSAVPTPVLKGDYTHDIPSRTRAARLRAVLEEAASKAGWGRSLGPNRGRGIATIEEADAFYAVVVEVTLDGNGWFSVDRVVVAGDPSFLVNPDNAEAQVEGCVAFGLTSALYGEITISEGRVVEGNFNDYQILRIHEMPKVETHWVLSRQPGWGGVGEPVVSAVIPALTNAIFDAGGPRIRSLPVKNHKIVKRGEGT